MPSEILENISLYCLISLAYFRLLFGNLSLIRSSTTRGSGTSILSRWSLQKLLYMDLGGQRTDQGKVAMHFVASCHRTNVFTVTRCFFSQLLFPAAERASSLLSRPARAAATEKVNIRY